MTAKYVNLRRGTASSSQQAVDMVVVSGTGLPGTAPVINNQSPAFADLAAVTTAYNALLAALRTRGVIAGS